MSLAFSDNGEKKFKELLTRYPKKEAALLQVLWLAQEEFDVLTTEVQKFVADKLELSLARVEGVVTFYTMYKREKVGQASHTSLSKYFLHFARRKGCDEDC